MPFVHCASSATSPYSGTTSGAADDTSVCGSGEDQGFFFELPPGTTITIGQTSNDFDSRHTLRYGGAYPGDNVVSCLDDPDLMELSYTNDGSSAVAVYFVVDSYYSSDSGAFVLEWQILTCTPRSAPVSPPVRAMYHQKGCSPCSFPPCS